MTCAGSFTGKERDAETGLDYFGARYMSAAQGRFTSPDEPLIDQHPADPQSWNLYSYTRNNPLALVDPTGMAAEPATCGPSNQISCPPDHKLAPLAPLPPGGTGPLDRPANVAFGWLKSQIGSVFNLIVGETTDPVQLAVQRALKPSNQRQAAGANASIVASVMLLPGAVKNMTSSALGLRKQLASESQMAELANGGGAPIIGAGTGRALRDAERLAQQYGGTAADWAKIRSASYKAPDGATFEIHAYKNISTGKVVEMKTVMDKWGKP